MSLDGLLALQVYRYQCLGNLQVLLLFARTEHIPYMLENGKDVLILESKAIHRADQYLLKRFCNAHCIFVEFIQLYSPMLNPIEDLLFSMKGVHVRKAVMDHLFL